MQFGVALRGRGPLATLDAIVKITARAEALRYASVFVTDHVVIPKSVTSVYPYSVTGKIGTDWAQGYLEPLSLMPYLAALTKRVKLGTSVLVVPYRNPVVTAKMLATVDVLSGGRVILGAGVGWMREEFEALGAPPWDQRGAVTDEWLRLMRECWTREPVSFSGAHYRLDPVSALPKPVQKGGIPIWTGGHTPGALRRAGALADGWHPIGMRPPAMLLPDEYGRMVGVVHEAARRAGRDPRTITLSLRAPLGLAGRRGAAQAGERPLFTGAAADVIADIRAYQTLGVSHFVFDPVTDDLRGFLAMMDRFADEVRPKVQRPPR